MISILLLTAVPLKGAGGSRLQFYYNIAEGNYLIGDRGGAERGIEQCLRLDPGHAPSLALLAKVRLDQTQPEAALEAAEQAIVAAPEELKHQTLKALILGHLDRRAEAITLLDNILLKAEPAGEHARTAQHLKGLLKMAEEKWDEAAEAFKKTYQTQPESSGSGRQLATEAYLEKARTATDVAQALAAINQAIELYRGTSGRENLETLSRLEIKRAQLLVQAGKTEQATLALQQIVGQNPDNLVATVTLASLYADREDWLALEDLIAPIAQNPLLADIALYLEGRVALARDRVGTARAKFEAALQQNNERPTELRHVLAFYMSLCYERLGRQGRAEQSLHTALEGGYEPETPDEAVHLGRLLLRQDQFDRLIPLLEKALLREPGSAEGWALLGRAHLKKGQNTLAISALNQSLLLDLEQPEVLALRGSLLRKLGVMEDALADYTRALRLLPASPVLSYEKGLVLLQLGRIDQAEPLLKTAARTFDSHSTLNLLHASCAYTLGRYEAATESLRQYLAPALTGEALARFQANFSDTAAYLHILLSKQAGIQLPELPEPSRAAQLFEQYSTGKASRKDVLDWAGRAESPERARAQICSAAFWLAQVEQQAGKAETHKELLHIALNTGQPENPEFQFAKWQQVAALKPH
ncbi:MAG: tetratricopeptide repeat protein [Opitutales bacterium]